jgi:hypothetical protein
MACELVPTLQRSAKFSACRIFITSRLTASFYFVSLRIVSNEELPNEKNFTSVQFCRADY